METYLGNKKMNMFINGKKVKPNKGNKPVEPPIDIPVTSVTISNKITQLMQGNTHQLNVNILPMDATNKSLTYTSSNTNIAIVSNVGLIEAKATGSVAITVKSNNNISDTMNLTIKEVSTSEALIIEQPSRYIKDGLYEYLEASLATQPSEMIIVNVDILDNNSTTHVNTRYDKASKKLTDANGTQIGTSLPNGCTAPTGLVLGSNGNPVLIFTPETYNIKQKVKTSVNTNKELDNIKTSFSLVYSQETKNIEYTLVANDNENIVDGIYYGFKIPYISFYYFNPKPMYNVDMIIPFYVSDYYQKEWLKNDESVIFDIECCVYNMDTTLYKKATLSSIKAGDREINIGKLEPKEYYLTIQAIQKDNGFVRKSQLLTSRIWVIDENYAITPTQTYTITQADLDKHSIKNTNSKLDVDMDNTRIGLGALWNEINSNGYRKCVMLPGTYRVAMDYTIPSEYNIIDVNGLKIPSNFTIDLNNAVLKLDVRNGFQADGITKINQALLINTANSVDSHLENGVVEGDWFDRQQAGLPYATAEESRSIFRFTGGRFCSFRNMILRQSTGHALLSKIGDNYGKIGASEGIMWTNSKIINGVEVKSNQYSTFRITNISQCTMLGFGRYLGYRAIRGGADTHVLIHFYDVDKKFIKTVPAMQYRHVFVPAGSYYARATVVGDLVAEGDVNSCFLTHGLGEHHEITNCTFEDCNTTAIATSVSEGLLIDNCTFNRCGYRITACPVDFEDGWQEAQDIYFRNSNELEHVGSAVIIDNAGYNHVYENNNMAVTARYSCYGEVIKNNYTGGFSLEMGRRAGTGHSRIQGFNITDKFIGNIVGLSPRDRYLESGGCITTCIKNSVLSGFINSLGDSWFYNCTFHKLSSYNGLDIRSSVVYGCQPYLSCTKMNILNTSFYGYGDDTFIKFSFNNPDSIVDRYFKDCNFYVTTQFTAHGSFNQGVWENCVFEKSVTMNPNLSNTMGKIQFNNCTFKDVVNINIQTTTCYIQFNNCTFLNSKNMNANAQNNTEFNNCIG